jgi:hypothetical protein
MELFRAVSKRLALMLPVLNLENMAVENQPAPASTFYTSYDNTLCGLTFYLIALSPCFIIEAHTRTAPVTMFVVQYGSAFHYFNKSTLCSTMVLLTGHTHDESHYAKGTLHVVGLGFQTSF